MNIVYSKSRDRWFRAVPVNPEAKFRLGAFGLLPQPGDCISELFSGPPSVWEHALPHATVVMATHVSAGNPIYSVYTLGKSREVPMSKSRSPCDAAQLVANLRPPTPEERRNGLMPLNCCMPGCTVNIRDSACTTDPAQWFDSVNAERCWEWRLCMVVGGQEHDLQSDLNWAPTPKETSEFAFELAHKLFGDYNPKHSYLVHSCGNDLCINPNHIKLAGRKYPVR